MPKKLKNWRQNLNSKKEEFLTEAERLFVYEYLPADAIAKQLNLNRKTINNWRAGYEWDKKRASFLKSKTSFHEELFEFARKIMREISADIDAGEKIAPARLNALCRFVPLFGTSKKYEDTIAQKEKTEIKRGLTPELIAQIEEEVLGITPNDNQNEEN